MDNVHLMNVCYSLQDSLHQLRCLPVRKNLSSLFYEIFETASRRKLHAHIKFAIELDEMFNFYNIWVI